MSIQEDLIPVLKKLRLSGLLQSLDVRRAQAIDENRNRSHDPLPPDSAVAQAAGGFQCIGSSSSSFEFGWEPTRTRTSRRYS